MPMIVLRAAAALLLVAAPPMGTATVTVPNANDNLAGSLRQAIQDASAGIHRASATANPLGRIHGTDSLTNKAQHAVVTWRGGQGDHRWSNAANWEGGHVPGASEVVRFTRASTSDSLVDQDTSGAVAGLVLEEGYGGTLSLQARMKGAHAG